MLTTGTKRRPNSRWTHLKYARCQGAVEPQESVDVTPSRATKDRATAVRLRQAIKDALGMPNEFTTPTRPKEPEMIGTGLEPYEPRAWSDDTQIMLRITRVATTTPHLATPEALDILDTPRCQIAQSAPAVRDCTSFITPSHHYAQSFDIACTLALISARPAAVRVFSKERSRT